MKENLIRAGAALALAAVNEYLLAHPGPGWTAIGRNPQTGQEVFQGMPEIQDGDPSTAAPAPDVSQAVTAAGLGPAVSDY